MLVAIPELKECIKSLPNKKAFPKLERLFDIKSDIEIPNSEIS